MKKVILLLAIIPIQILCMDTKDTYDNDPRTFVCNDMHAALKDYFDKPFHVNPPSEHFNTDIAKEQRQHLRTLQILLTKCKDKELSAKAENFVQIISARIEHEEKTATCSTYLSVVPRSPQDAQKCRNKAFGKYLNTLLHLEK